jgi:hypothetical protein
MFGQLNKILRISALATLLSIHLAIPLTAAVNTALGNLAASMPQGTWAELTTTDIRSTLANTSGADGMTLPYSDTATWDSVSQQLFFIGGDHAPTPCYPRFVSYSESTNAWQIRPQPAWFPCTPSSAMHGYNHTAIDAVHRKLYHRPFNDAVVRKYDIDSQVWTALPAVPQEVIGYISVAVGLAWFPERNSLVYASIESGTNGTALEYSETTGQWTKIAGNLPMGGYHNFAKYNPVHKIVLFGGGQGDRHIYKLDTAGHVTALKDAPIPVGIENSVITVDPASGKYLIFGNSNDFYVYDVTSDTWVLQSGARPPIFDSPGYIPPLHGIVVSSVSNYGVSMFVRCHVSDCHVYLYKHYADITPPLLSISSPVTGTTVSGTVLISTNASDNIGGAGLAGVQFKLGGNNLGTEDTAAPYETVWDTTTVLNSPHTLTAVARDLAGNQTTSAPVAVIVSNSIPFTFSLSGGGNLTLTQGQSASRNISAVALSGTVEPVSFSVAGLPSQAAASLSVSSCTPDCTSTLAISTSASTPAGTYSISVTGRAASADRTTSFILTVSSVNATFAEKCNQFGVLSCFGFDDSSTLYYTWPTGTVCDTAFAGKNNYSFGRTRSGAGNTAAVVQNGNCVFPQIDTAGPHSGSGALKFSIPSQSGPDSGGFFSEPFKRNSEGTFPHIAPGSPAGNTVYFQFYQKFDSNFASTNFQCVLGECGGWKQAIWYGNPPNGSSSSSLEVTMFNGWQRNVPQMYGQQGFDDYGIEDIIGCTYARATSQGGSGSGFGSRPNYASPLNPACVHYEVNQWMEFTGRIEVRDESNSPASRVQLWANGQLVIDNPHARINWGGADGDGLGQFLLSPYHTNKDPNQIHDAGYTWYDDLIVSTEPIPMVNGGIPAPGNTPPVITDVIVSGTTSTGATITWVTNKPADSQIEYGTTTGYGQTTARNPALDTNHSVQLAGLSANTTYYFRIASRDAGNNLGLSQGLSFATLLPPDTIPPVISEVAASKITAFEATISWMTDEPAISYLEYGRTLSYGNQTTLDSSFVTPHSRTLSGLAPGILYNYRIKSRDAEGNVATSSNFTFTTLPLLPPPNAGLIGYWPFDEGSGGSAADLSGNNHNGILANGPVWTAGKVGAALRFDATDDTNDDNDPRILIGNTFDVSGIPFTLSAWVNPVDFNDYRAILSKRDSVDPSKRRFDWGFNISSGTNYLQGKSAISFTAPPANTWTHLTIVATSASTLFYVNGTLAKTLDGFEIGTSDTANTVIGGTGERPGGDNDPFKGTIDELRVYNRALSTAEIQQVYFFSGDSTPPDTTPPVISAIAASNIISSGMTINWTTNEAADSQVEYGVTTRTSQTTPLDTALVTGHSVTLSGLAADTTYRFVVKSADAARNSATSEFFSFTTAAPPSTTGLIGYWAFDEGRGNTTADSSGNGNTGNLSYNPKWTTGKIGKALRFDGTDNNNNDAPRVVAGSGFDVSKLPFTLSAWINPADFRGSRTILSKRDSYKTSKMRFDWGLSPDSGTVYLAEAGNSVKFNYVPPANTWTNLAVVATSKETKLYVNGTARETLGPFDIGNGHKANTVIGSTGESPEDGDTDPFRGMIDELRVYDRVLSAFEVREVYEFAGGITHPSAPDTRPPLITKVTVSSITSTQVTITWVTDEPADSQVEYAGNGNNEQTTARDNALIASHSVNLSGLVANTKYRFIVTSRDAVGNVGTGERLTFTTLAGVP